MHLKENTKHIKPQADKYRLVCPKTKDWALIVSPEGNIVLPKEHIVEVFNTEKQARKKADEEGLIIREPKTT